MIRRDRRGMAVLLDAMIFLAVLTLVGAFLMVPGDDIDGDAHATDIRAFHSVMLGGEMPDGDGSALSRTSLEGYIVLLSRNGGAITPAGMARISLAVNGTLSEMSSMGMQAWWVLTMDGEEHMFGHRHQADDVSVHADRREVTDSAVCVLYAVV